MSRTGGRDNPFERAVRSGLHERRLRFRVHYPVPDHPKRTIDIAFTKWRVAVFLDGCFWHGCPVHGTMPKRNAAFWAIKIQQNKERDVLTDTALTKSGWQVLRIWQHEGPVASIAKIHSAIDNSRKGNIS